MENFIKALNEAIHAWSHLSKEWEKIESFYSDKLSDGYPFNKDFREVVRDLIDWKDKISG